MGSFSARRAIAIHPRFRWYIAGQACWFVAFGIQSVLYPHLVVNVLNEGPERIGIAQMAQMAPSLLLMMIGGALADATDLRTLVVRLQLMAMVPASVLAALLWLTAMPSGSGSTLSYGVLVVFALAFGALQAFVVPARDALLSRVAGDDLQRAVSTALAVQFAAQVLGFVVASNADRVGPEVILAVQALAFGLGAAATRLLEPAPPLAQPRPGPAPVSRLRTVTAGARVALGTAHLRPVLVLMAGVGFFFISVFMVVVPVMVRDFYGGGARELALVNGAFVAGTILSTLALSRLRPVRRQGRAIFGALMVATVLTAGFAAYPPQLGFYLLIFAFGLASGILVALGRTVVQESAPAAERGRVLAFYSLCFLGSAPLGAYLIGQAAGAVGVLTAALGAAGGMSVLLVVTGFTTPIWSLARGAGR